MLHITSIKFKNYKSFDSFSLALNEFNILVGPNNAGKSTVIAAFKILAEGIRKAKHKRPKPIQDPDGIDILGYALDLNQVPVALENVFHNYIDEVPAIIRFRLSDSSYIQIFFPAKGECYMNFESATYTIKSPSDYTHNIGIEIGFVPVLGPVDHDEPLYQVDAARLALLTYKASRNFRNIWYHYPEDFEEFKALIKSTWPGMDIDRPEVNFTGKHPIINMFCPEERIPREIFWAGFGFQVWCQMLTFIIKNKHSTIFLVDEPDIYLHSDLQRQLLNILKNLGPDIIIATHSTEIISESDLNDIIIINKTLSSGKRIKDPSQLQGVFNVLGSNLNPTLTQIAKSKRVLFVEGKDFSIFSKFARKLGYEQVANRSDFAVVPVEGFNPARLRAFKAGIEKTIGEQIVSAVIFDRDYRSKNEVEEQITNLSFGNVFVHIHEYKEVENFLIVPQVIEKAILSKIQDYNKRTNKSIVFKEDILAILSSLSNDFKLDISSQLQSYQLKFERSYQKGNDESKIIKSIITDFEAMWADPTKRYKLVPGKDFISILNGYLQAHYKISITTSNIINSFDKTLIPKEMKELIKKIEAFRTTKI